MSCFVKAVPRANMGEKMELKYCESVWKDILGKNAVRKEYSKEALSIRAVLKAWKGTSR
jgi:hypothetical protein